MIALTRLFCAERKSELSHGGRWGVQLKGEPILSLLKNKIAVVTGGSSGIGLATAKRFVEEGAYVFIAGRRQAELDKAVAEIGSNVTGVKADIAKLDDLDRLYETVAKKGKIDVIFAGAAFVEKMMTAAATPEHFDKTFNTNARSQLPIRVARSRGEPMQLVVMQFPWVPAYACTVPSASVTSCLNRCVRVAVRVKLPHGPIANRCLKSTSTPLVSPCVALTKVT